MKIVELYISPDDEESGVEFLSLVKNPATHQSWQVFEDETECNGSCQISKHLNETGEDLMYLLDNSYGFKVEDLSDEELTINKEGFYTITSQPNTVQPNDGLNNQIVRYYYAVDTGLGPNLIKSSRKLCRQLIRADLVYGDRDLTELSSQVNADPDSRKLVPRTQGTTVDLKIYKAGKYCRHLFKKIVFTVPQGQTIEEFTSRIPKRSRTALNSRISGDGTRPTVEKQVGRGGISEYKIYMSEDYEGPITLIEGLVVYNTINALFKGEPECMAISEIEFDGFKGYIGVVPDTNYFENDVKVLNSVYRENFESYDDYPQYTSDNAKRGIELNEKVGNKCATQTGKVRAQQLANREPISEETIARMYSYLSRAEEYYDPNDIEACGTISVLLWGGLETKEWAQRKLEQIREDMKEEFSCVQQLLDNGYGEEEARMKCYEKRYPETRNYPDNVLPLSEEEDFIYENPCQEGYIAYGTKIKDGREVPNCVPINARKDFDKEPMDIYGYSTRYFDICPLAKQVFVEMMETEQDPNNIGMIRSAAQIADNIFKIEYYGIEKGFVSDDKVAEAEVLIFDYKDLIKQIEKTHNKNYDVSYMDSHLEVIKELNKNQQMEQSFADEMKYEITSVVMEPNKYIARRDEIGNIYYVFFSEDTVKMMSQKFFKQDRHKSFNYEHSGLKLNGGYVVESWLVSDPESDKARQMGFSVNKGTWMVTLKWDDKKQFEQYVTSGKTMGISLEGNFLSKPFQMNKLKSPEDINKLTDLQAKLYLDEIVNILNTK